MMQDLGWTYNWVFALHVISIVAWMAGLLYLPRLFVYHAAAAHGSELSETFKVMERRLLRGIMTPAMIAVYVTGLWNLWLGAWWSDLWMQVKLALVVLLTVYHHALARWRRDFEADRNRRPAKFFRVANEVPTLLLIAIVLLVVLKPF